MRGSLIGAAMMLVTIPVTLLASVVLLWSLGWFAVNYLPLVLGFGILGAVNLNRSRKKRAEIDALLAADEERERLRQELGAIDTRPSSLD